MYGKMQSQCDGRLSPTYIGLTLTPWALDILIPQEKNRRNVVNIWRLSYIVDNLDDLVMFLSDLQHLLDTSELPGQMAGLTVESSSEDCFVTTSLESRVRASIQEMKGTRYQDWPPRLYQD